MTMFLTPESPKHMMTDGRHREALESLRRIYTINTWKSRDSYPVIYKFLINYTIDNFSIQFKVKVKEVICIYNV